MFLLEYQRHILQMAKGGLYVAVIRFGRIIKKRREDLGLTQEDLADGICSVPTLSRIENGERIPTKNIYERLLQRLGYSGNNFDIYTDEKDFRIHELQFNIRQAYIEGNIEAARKYLAAYSLENTEDSNINRQFHVLYSTLLYQKDYPIQTQLERFEEAIRLTSPRYDQHKIPHILSYEEINLINNIAFCHAVLGNRAWGIELLLQLKDYYHRHIVNPEEALRTQPMVLYNLSKMLGLEGRYDECVEICDLGIKLAKTTGRASLLSRTLYNKAWALIKRNELGDFNQAKLIARQALYMATIMGQKESLACCQRLYKDTYGEDISL